MSAFFDEESLKLLESINLCHKIANASKKISKKSSAIRQSPIKCGRNVSSIIKNGGLEIATSSTIQNADDIGNKREIGSGHQEVVTKPMQDQRVNAISFLDDQPREAIRFQDKQRAKVSELLESQCREVTTLLEVQNSKANLASLDDRNSLNSLIGVDQEVNNGEENLNAVKTKLLVKKDEKEVDISKEAQKNTEGCQIKKLPSAKRQKHPLIENKLQVKRDFMPLKRSSFSEDTQRTLDKGQTFNHLKKKGDAGQTVDTPPGDLDDGCQPNAEAIDSKDEKILDNPSYKESSPSSEVVNPHCSSIPGNKIAATRKTRRVVAILTFPVGAGKNRNASIQDAESQLTKKLDAGEVVVGSSSEENKDEAQFRDMTTKEVVSCSSNKEEVHSSKPESQFATDEHKTVLVFNNDKAQSSEEESQWTSKMQLEEVNDVKRRKRMKEDCFEIVALKKGKHDFLVSNASNAIVPTGGEEVDARTKVMETLSSFQSIYDSLPQNGNLFQANHQLALKLRDMTTKEVVSCSSNNEEVHSSKPESQFATDEHQTVLVFNNDNAQSSEEESQPTSKMQLEEVSDVKRRKRMKEDCFEIVALKKGKHDFLVSNANNAIVPTGGEEVEARTKVMETLSSFRSIYDSLPQKGNLFQANHQLALKLLKERIGGSTSNQRFIGNVPGVEIGDEFRLRVEMFIIGLHNQYEAGIDYIKHNGKDVAISIVSSGRYSNERINPNVLLYSGSGVSHEDQKLEQGNLALKNSIEAQIPVRVIHGIMKYQPKRGKIYVYDGLYLAEKYWMRKSNEGHFVLMFRLRRIPGQPEFTIGKKQRCSNLFPPSDVSNGEEDMPIRVVNTTFKYTTKLIHPSSYIPTPPNSCDCLDGCSDSKICACAVKNGGKIPFNSSGAIMKAKPLVYECGPSCKCPPTCHNRVSQRGIKFQLEIYKTGSRGWAVRSSSFIPSGSFVCEYIGERLMDEEAQKRANDEYVFAIGSNYHDKALWKGLSKSIPSLRKGPSSELLDTGFAVHAFDVGRFINHSSTPNLYAQNVIYDHDNIRMPHIMLFASEDIQSFEELTYDYNYVVDQVHDLNGNVKKQECYCGSQECNGWLY